MHVSLDVVVHQALNRRFNFLHLSSTNPAKRNSTFAPAKSIDVQHVIVGITEVKKVCL